MRLRLSLIGLYLCLNVFASVVIAKSNFGVVYQYGLLDDFLHGEYTPIATVKDIAQNNDFGIGAGIGLGELIIVDGNFYLANPYGKLEKLKNNDNVSIVTAVNFNEVNRLSFKIPGVKNFKQLTQIIESKIDNKNLMYAVRIKGYFDKLSARSEDVDHIPYTPIVDWMKLHQHQFDCDRQISVIVMFKTPSNLSDIQVPYHAHFVNQARTLGGHVFELSTTHEVQIDIIPIDKINIILRKQYAPVLRSSKGLQKDEFLNVVESGGGK